MRSILTKSIFSRILGSKVGVRVLYSCGLYSAVYGMHLEAEHLSKLHGCPRRVLREILTQLAGKVSQYMCAQFSCMILLVDIK